MFLFKLSTIIFASVLLSRTGCSLFVPEPNFVRPEVHLTNLTLKNATLFETALECTVRVDNENSEDVTIDGGTHKLYLNDLYVGKGFSKESVTIGRFSTAEVPVEISLSNLSMLTKIVSIVEAPEISYIIDSSLVLGGKYSGSRVSSSTKDTLTLPKGSTSSRTSTY